MLHPEPSLFVSIGAHNSIIIALALALALALAHAQSRVAYRGSRFGQVICTLLVVLVIATCWRSHQHLALVLALALAPFDLFDLGTYLLTYLLAYLLANLLAHLLLSVFKTTAIVFK